MSNKKKQEQDDLQNVEQALSKTEQFIEKNRKKLLYSLIILVVIAVGVVLFFNMYVGPKNIEAADMMVVPTRYFEQDSFALALNGDGANIGFADIVNDYSITKSSDLAALYAGICCYKLEQYDDAISYLKKFDAESVNMEPASITLIGDCYVAKNEYESAIKYFKKAAKFKNKLTAPLALGKAGVCYEELKQYDEAEKCYQAILDEYYDSPEVPRIEKYLEHCKAMK